MLLPLLLNLGFAGGSTPTEPAERLRPGRTAVLADGGRAEIARDAASTRCDSAFVVSTGRQAVE